MPTSSLELSYRPLRIGFVVRPQSTADLLQAVEWATWVWGGMFSPIIPLTADDDVDRAIAAWNVDVLAPVMLAKGTEAATDEEAVAGAERLLERHPYLDWPSDVRHLGLFAPIDGDADLAAVDVQHLVDHLWHDRFRHDESSPWALPRWSSDDEYAALFACTFGDVGTGAVAARLQRAYQNGLRATEIRVDESVDRRLAQLGTPIALTTLELRRYGGSRGGDGLYVGDPGDASDLRRFWNLRAQGYRVAFFPAGEDGQRLRAYLEEHLQRLPPQSSGAWGTVWRAASWEPGESLPAGIERLVPEGMPVLRAVADRDTPEARWYGHFAAERQAVLATVEDSGWGTRMVFALPSSPFPRSRGGSFFSHWAVTLATHSEHAYRPKTIALPGLPDLNEWVTHEMTRSTREVRVQPGSLDVIVSATETDLDLSLLDQAQVVRKLLARAGITAVPSGAGEVADRIIRQMGGLQGCRIFRAAGARELLGSDDAHHEQTVLAKLEIGGGLDEVPRAKTPVEAMDLLLRTQALRPLLRVKCPECQIWRLFDPEALATHVRCPGCGSEFLLATHLRHGEGEKARSTWRYRRSGLLAEHGHEGSIPVILGMLRLENTVNHGRGLFVLPSHRLTGDEVDCESDLLALELDRGGRPAIVLSELKSRRRISSADLRNLAEVGRRIRHSGIGCYLLFGKIGTFTRQELELFRNYHRRNEERGDPTAPALILLGARELVHYNVHEETRGELGSDYHVFSLADLARNTTKLYLEQAD